MMNTTEAAQRKLYRIFRELDAILDRFPSSDWSPDDAQAVLDVIGRRYCLHESSPLTDA
jgi:hypothetical protein